MIDWEDNAILKGVEPIKADGALEREIIPSKLQFKASGKKSMNLIVLYRESNCISETLILCYFRWK